MRSAVIGVGASAGGLEALSGLLGALPANLGAVILVVQHLERDHESLLASFLGRRTSIPVVQAAAGMQTEADHIYVIPPNTTLTMSSGHLVLTPRAPGSEVHKPVDALFRSLAQEYGECAVGVVLSGGDSDGSEGVQAIKQAGGITLAQAPQTAAVPSMPLSAIETGCIDMVLPPEEIALELARLARHPYVQMEVETDADPSEAADADALRTIFRRIRDAHGLDFTRYKSSTLRRRLARRMAVHKMDRLTEYAQLIARDAAETAVLYQDFLIRVTSFFRDPESFAALTTQVFPALAATRSPTAPIRIWVPGCSTGEEVYSIAISLLESLGQSAAPRIQIFGTDVCETAIEKCRSGEYSDAIELDVSPERLRRFFVKQGTHYFISRTVRDLCVFARHDITRDPPYSHLDLISCRNLLIYLGTAAQNRVMQVFRYALRANGYLLLGASESVGQGEELFEPIDKQHQLYRPKAMLTVAALGLLAARDFGPGTGATTPARRDPGYMESDAVQRQADRLLLTRYSPAAILVDENLNILQFRGNTAPFLSPASGPPSLNLARIGRPELLVAVPPLMQEARTTGRPVSRSGLWVENAGAVTLEVVPLAGTTGVHCFLILLTEVSAKRAPLEALPASPPAVAGADQDPRLVQLERENFELRDFLQVMMERHEAAREELKSTHEELLSANEEFQSTNEELETSKEELQSANEELSTTNVELRERNQQLALLNAEVDKARQESDRARGYAEGIVETVREPLVVLDQNLTVLRVNQAFCKEFQVTREAVCGRELPSLDPELWSEQIGAQLKAILVSSQPVSDFDVSYQDPRRGTRILCLNGRKIPGDAERGELILLAIEDVSEARKRSAELSEGSRRKDEFLAMLAHELRNPLSAITHSINVLKQEPVAQASAMHALIERQTGRLVRLVNDLMDVARVSRGLIELQRVPVDLAAITRAAADAARGRLESQRHRLVLSIPEFPMVVEGDAVRLEQVVSNLLENAIKYTKTGGLISVSLAEEGEDCELRVRDNGIGIAPENLRRIFEIFTQIEPARSSTTGLGLGLSVVRRILEMHGGRIDAHSEGLGQGSEFIARLPRISASLLDARETGAPGARVAATRRRVLIVDDNADASEVMSLMLKQWGHEVITADCGAAALKALETFPAEVAFVDIGLPDMDGHELARRIHADPDPHHRPGRLVALTGYGTEADRQRSRGAGFDEHLIKPAEIEQLVRQLDAGSRSG